MRNCIQIKSDLFDIAKRLKEIDSGYFVVRHKGRFEVHNRNQRGGSFCIAVPYPKLDCRTLQLIRRTKSERAADYLQEIEEENSRLGKQMLRDAAAKAEQQAEKLLAQNLKAL